jgi:hypothetical protein
MLTTRSILASIALSLLLAGCGEGTATSARGKLEAIKPLPHRPSGPRVEAGLEGVIGADRSSLERQFGAPRLDVREGDALKLQWSGGACILDVYLYPPARGIEPSASYVDARRGDGRDVDKASCITALKQGK